MKKITIYTLFLFFILVAVRYCRGQDETTMSDILNQVSSKVKELENDKNQEIVNITIDLLIMNVQKSFIRYLDPSFEYTIIAIGDRRIDTLTLAVYRPGENNVQYVSENSGKFPMVHISLLESEQFGFVVNANKYSGNNVTGHFAVIIYHKIP